MSSLQGCFRGKGQGEYYFILDINIYLNGGCKKDDDRLFPVVPSDRTSDNGHKLKHKGFPLMKGFSFNMKKYFHCEDDRALAQVAHGGCGVSIFRDIKKTSRYGSGQLGV